MILVRRMQYESNYRNEVTTVRTSAEFTGIHRAGIKRLYFDRPPKAVHAGDHRPVTGGGRLGRRTGRVIVSIRSDRSVRRCRAGRPRVGVIPYRRRLPVWTGLRAHRQRRIVVQRGRQRRIRGNRSRRREIRSG